MVSSAAYPRRAGPARAATGFTLIELMITAAVVAILAAIAYANYRNYVINSRRTAATACLLERAQFLERYYTANLTYEDAPDPPDCDPEVARFYEVGWTTGGEPGPKTYTLQAVPQGTQEEDKCGALTLDAQGERGEGGSETEVADCW